MRIAIIHISDLHLTSQTNPLEEKLEALVAAISTADSSCENFIVVLSGDIANTGDAEEYTTAIALLDQLRQLIITRNPAASVDYVAVPGNHDCSLPKGEIKLRAALVEAISETIQTNAPDQAILESLLSCQKAYFDFCRLFKLPVSGLERVCAHKVVKIKDHRLGFLLYNTSLLSTRDEQQGELSLPMESVRSLVSIDTESDLVISVFHHPYNWLQSDVGIAFRAHVESTSEIVLTGHQHIDHAYTKQPLTGQATFYSEGNVLQELSWKERSGFRLIESDLDASKRRVFTYQWKDRRYSLIESTEWETYKRSTSLGSRPSPQAKYLERLSDSGVGLTHRTRGPVPLDTVFVYPDAQTSPLSASDSQKEIKGENLLRYVSDTDRIVISGGPYLGKTSLAKTMCKEWLRTRSFYPLLIDGRTVKEANESFIERFIKTAIAESYGSENLEQYRQLPSSVKALVIDDWDESPLSETDRNRFLQVVLRIFGKTVLFVHGMSYIQHIITTLKDTEAILTFEFVVLRPLSHVARGSLIEKWLSLEASPGDPSFARKLEQTERLVETIIGKNTLPSVPFIVLAILEASQRDSDTLPENGSFGYLYEILITAALSSTKGDKSQLDKKYTFLSLLAFHLFDNALELIPENELSRLLDGYSTGFKVKVDKGRLLEDLEASRVLMRIDGNYKFGYDHYFHYFLARHFKNNLHGQDAERFRQILNSLVGGLNVGANNIFLMFFIYLSHDEQLIDHCVSLADRILAGVAPSDLTTEVEFYNSKETAGIERPVPESIDLEESRRKRREAADLNGSKDNLHSASVYAENEGYSNDLPLPTKLDYAFRCIHLLGQILRNFTGSLPGDRKMAILRSTYLLGLRAMRSMLEIIGGATLSARKELARKEEAIKEGHSDRNENEYIRRAEKLLTIIGQLVGVSMIQNLSMNVGSPDIEETAYEETLEGVGRNSAAQLVDLSIRLDHSTQYPINQIKKLHRDLASNRFGQMVLKDLVIANMHVFEIGHEMRQRVLAVLESGKPNDSILSQTGKRFKQR